MRVARIEAFPIDLQYRQDKEFRVSYGVIDSMQNAIVRVTTDDGLVGYGELMPLPLGDRAACIKELQGIGPSVLGQDPFDIREIHARMDDALGVEIGSRQSLLKGSIDFALHDIMGRAAGVPVYRILGGNYDDGVPMHFTISIRSPEEMGEDTAARVAEGFRTIEVKLGRFEGELDLDTEIARIAAIREAAGPDVVIIADPNIGWTTQEAIDVLPSMEQFNVYVEQPVKGIEALGQVRAAISSPVIADESAANARVLAEIIRREAADLINLKILRTGGLYEASKMLDICESFGIGYRHDNVIQSRLASTMMIHFSTTYNRGLPDGGGTQFIRTVQDVVNPDQGVYLDGGVAKLRDPDAPGLGATPREELLRDPIVIAG
ncbi:MAG TPA: enolase C-terminal domain-like protein [Ilumatobacteraceae bacterium]|nr:enolase C-terminal domain-like protein [Ilumatobacteraceae bacterium]